jgi:hypothetical protein
MDENSLLNNININIAPNYNKELYLYQTMFAPKNRIYFHGSYIDLEI